MIRISPARLTKNLIQHNQSTSITPTMWSKIFLSYLVLVTRFSFSFAKTSDELLVQLNHGGGVTGHYRSSHSGRGIVAYTNIPYAEAPINDLRFSDPVKKSPWTGYLASNREFIKCPHKKIFMREQVTTGVEDCLYLNVYAPLHHRQNPKENPLPVMVYFHGGGFTTGTGSHHMYDPANILDNDVILVTMNYRLGALGFASTFKGEMTGNWGMKDQQMALQWVQENIKSFDGDKNKVTIFGISAGGASVGLHLMAPNSKGLFQQAIMLSGTPYYPWALHKKEIAVKNGEKLIGLLGCDEKKDDHVEMMQCLRKVPIEDILETTYQFYEWDVDPLVPFGPVLEENESLNPFIEEKDVKEISDVPLIIGLAKDDGTLKTAIMEDKPELIDELESKFSEILPSVLGYSHLQEPVQKEITEKIQNFYLEKDQEFNWARDKFKYQDMATDALFTAGFDKFLQQRLQKKNQSNTFVYLLNYRGTSSFTDFLVNAEEDRNWGVSHSEDAMFLFPLINLMPHRVMSDRDLKFGRMFVKLFTDFAVTGNPGSPTKNISWNPVTMIENFEYLRIGNCNREYCPKNQEIDSELLQGLFEKRRSFWRELYLVGDRQKVKDEF